MTTLKELAEKYEEDNRKAAAEAREREEAEFQKRTADVKKQFEELGLIPESVDGNVATFSYEGETIVFSLIHWKYGQWGIRRILGQCPHCPSVLRTFETAFNEYGIGSLLSNPTEEQHECEYLDRPAKVVQKQKTHGEVLLEAIDAYIDFQLHRYEE